MTTADAGGPVAYVHIRHPDLGTSLVGRYRLVLPNAGRPFGEFEYVGSWLRNEHGRAFALDPDHLPSQRGPFIAEKRARLPGVLADATPDRWERRLIEDARPPGRPPMRPWEWLLATGDERVGCLAFSPTPSSPPLRAGSAASGDLASIAEGFEHLQRGESPGGLAEKLWKAGISMGGAGPKAVIAHGERSGSPSSRGGTIPTTSARPSTAQCASRRTAGSASPRPKLSASAPGAPLS